MRCVEEKIIVAPIAQAKKSLRNPRQKRQHNADLQAQNNIEDNAKLCRHLADSKLETGKSKRGTVNSEQ
jgi:hypothetical protein